MAAQALYRKWRSRTFDEVVGQEPIMRTLRNALRDGRIAHAYLLTGPRGTGKTSTARILAKAVNCEAPLAERPCNQCRICRAVNEDRLLDLIEIDAASHTGVDNMRETVIDRVNFRPSEARFKVYIIDEVHMLSTSSFNALLKTLEEPPAHVIFILATTDVQKVPATVISRCQRFDFRRIPQREVVRHLQVICETEQHQAELEALNAIARYATGCMRDAITLLDQLMAYGGEKITAQQVEAMLGTAPSMAIARLVEALATHNAAAALDVIGELAAAGIELREMARQTVDHLRALLLIQLGGSETLIDLPGEIIRDMGRQARLFDAPGLLRAIRLFNQAAVDLRGNLQSVPQLALELAVVEAALDMTGAAPAGAIEAASRPAPGAGQTAGLAPGATGHATVEPPRSERDDAAAAFGAASERATAAPPTQAPAPVAAAASPSQAPAPAAFGAANAKPAAAAASPSRAAIASDADKLNQLRQNWAQIKELLQGRRRMLLGILTGGVRFLGVEGNEVIIGYDGSKKEAQYNARRLLEPENKATLETVLSEVLNGPYRVSVMTEDQYRARSRPPAVPPAVTAAAPVAAAPPRSASPEDEIVAVARRLGAVVSELPPD